MRFIHLLIAIIFVLFAYWQINDPDPFGWIVIYLGVSAIAIANFLGRDISWLSLVGLAATFFGLVLLLPDFFSWLADGMPSITGSMHAESLYIELVREFLGFLLAGAAYAYYFFKKIKDGTCID